MPTPVTTLYHQSTFDYVFLTSGTFVEWRGLAVFGTVTVVVYFVATLFIPDSPVWLVSSGREEDARETLRRLRGHQYCVEYDLQQIISSKANQYVFVLRNCI